MKKVFIRFMTVILCSSILVGCAPIKTKVTYTVYPTGFILERLAGDLVETESIQDNSIVQRSTIKENYADILSDSAVFMYIGLEPYLTVYDSEIKSMSSLTRLDLSSLNAVYKFQRYTAVKTGDDTIYVESPYYDDPSFDNVDTDTLDLFLWNDPIAMLSMAKDVCEWLDTAFPENKATFDENLKTLETELINLDAKYQSLATSNQNNNKHIRFVTMTASFGNWQKTYGFEVYPVILSKYGVLPNEEQLQVIKEKIIEDDVHYIVYEPNMTEDMITLFDELQEELGLTRVELSNLSSLTDEEQASLKDYISIMNENLQVLETMAEDNITE